MPKLSLTEVLVEGVVRFRAYDAVRFGCGSLRTHWATRTSSVRTPVRSELHIGENDIAGPEGIGGQIWTIVPGRRRKIRLAPVVWLWTERSG